MTKDEIVKELRRIIKEAVTVVGGSGGRRECAYCLRNSFPNQPQHWRKGFKNQDSHAGYDVESTHHCPVTVMKAAVEELTK